MWNGFSNRYALLDAADAGAGKVDLTLASADEVDAVGSVLLAAFGGNDAAAATSASGSRTEGAQVADVAQVADGAFQGNEQQQQHDTATMTLVDTATMATESKLAEAVQQIYRVNQESAALVAKIDALEACVERQVRQ
jgi:hypothetical protein